MRLTPGIIVFWTVVFLAAYAWETVKRRRKPLAEMEQMMTGHDWRKWKTGLKELRRRGVDIEGCLPLLFERMLVDKRMRREAARITVSDIYPHLRSELRGDSSADDPAVSREKLAFLLARYPQPDSMETDVQTTGYVR